MSIESIANNYLPESLLSFVKESKLVREIYLRNRLCWISIDRQGVNMQMKVPRSYRTQYGNYEPNFTDRIIEEVSTDTVFFDIGAGHGYYSLLSAKITDPELIHSFEPNILRSSVLMKNNVSLYDGRINVVNKFVSDNNNGDSVRLDDYCTSENSFPDLIKLDIEGHEYKAIRGMEGILTEKRPKIFVELHDRKLKEVYGENAEKVSSYVEGLGYEILYSDHEVGRQSSDLTEDTPDAPNYMAYCFPK